MRRVEIDTTRLVEVFAGDGLHGVGIVEIARATGVAKPTLYRAYSSKDALFLAAVEAEVERLLERLYAAWSDALAPARADVAPGRDPLASAIAALAAALITYGEEQPAGFRLLFVTAAHERSAVAADVADTLDRIVDRLTELLARHPAWHADPADAELVAALLPAAVASALRRAEEPWDRAALAARVGALLHPPAFGG